MGRWTEPRGVRQVVLLCRALLVVVLALVTWTAVPALLGWHSTVVVSGSMSPAVRTGDVVLTRPVPADRIRVGDVLLVRDDTRPTGQLMHRVVAVTPDGLQLRGDANLVDDRALVEPAQVRGVAVLRSPMLGLPTVWLRQRDWTPLTGTTLTAGLVSTGALMGVPRRLRSRTAAGPQGVGDPPVTDSVDPVVKLDSPDARYT